MEETQSLPLQIEGNFDWHKKGKQICIFNQVFSL